MKILFLFLFLFFKLVASEYYSKAEPVETYSIQSAVNGKVLAVNDLLEGKISDGTVLIHIDDVIDKADLKATKQKLKSIKNSVALTRENLKYSKKAYEIDKASYARIKDLSTLSRSAKEAKLLKSIASQSAYIKIKLSLENLLTSKNDLELKIASLKDKISKKNIKIKKNLYIYKIYPNRGDYINFGMKLVDASDISKAKLTIFITDSDLDGIENKTIYLNGKKTDYKLNKLWQIADSTNISSYKAEIIINKPKRFSSLIKVEFK
jgi:multidrug efflux pump subunit AcrA (membrane-fusion protein)